MAELSFSIAALKRAFGPFDWEKITPQAFVFEQYLDHYGLRFRTDAHQLAGFVSAGDYEVAVQVWQPPTPLGSLFIVHGYFDHVGLYGHLIRWALSKGLAVFAFDLPGHGLSSGPAAVIKDFQEYQQVLSVLIDHAIDHMPRPWYAVGQSTGAGILADNALQKTVDFQFSKFVMLAPLLRITSWGAVTITWQLLRRFQDYVPRGFGENSHDQTFMNFQQYEDPLQCRGVSTDWVGAMIRWAQRMEDAKHCDSVAPLIIQGEEDTTVDYAFNLPVYERKFPSASIFRLPDARHHLVNESQIIRDRFFDVMGEYLL